MSVENAIVLAQSGSLVKADDFQMKLEAYVSQNLAKLDAEHQRNVKRNYFLHKELSLDEYKEHLDRLEKARFEPPDNWDRKQWAEQISKEIELFKRDMNKTEEYQRFRKGKECELRNYPVNNDKVIQNIKEYVDKKINYYHKDLIDSYFQMFVDKISKICPQDKNYSKTISSVYNSKNSKIAMNILLQFFNALKNELMTLAMNVKRVQSTKFVEMQNLLKKSFIDVIEKLHGAIYDFIEQKIDYVDDGETMTDSKAFKVYAEMIMGELNQTLMNELPPMLDETFREQIEWTKEDLSIRWEREIGIPLGIGYEQPKALVEPINEPKVDEPINESKVDEPVNEYIVEPVVVVAVEEPQDPMKSFISTLLDEEIEVNDLTKRYNIYFGKSVSVRGFGMLKEIKANFTKHRRLVNGTKLTFYRKA